MANKKEYLDEKGLARLAEDLEVRHPSTFTGTRAEWAALPQARKDLIKIVNFTDDDDTFLGIRHPNIFTGTRAEWAALPHDEKVKYLLVCLTDDLSGIGWYLSDEVALGNMNPVTSNAVAKQKGEANGIAELDNTGKVPSSQLPSYVDDVLEYSTLSAFPTTGETGKIYIALDTNKTYRWSGTTYTVIASDLALGETSSTAYRGDRGKVAYDHANAKGKAYSSGLYKITTNSEGHVTAATAVSKADITALGIPSSDTNTTYSLSTGDGNGQIKVTPSSGSAYNISVKGLGNLAYISKDSNTSHYLRGDGSWVTPPDTDTKVDNTVWQSTTSGAKHKRSNSGDQWGLIKNDGSYSAWMEYESGNIATPGSLTANGGIGTDGKLNVKGDAAFNSAVTLSGTYLTMYNCKFNVTPKNGYPYFEAGGTNYCMVLGDNNHRYKLSWTGSALRVYVDDTDVGRVQLV